MEAAATIALVIAVVIVVAILGARSARLRRELMQRVAASISGTFHKEDPFGLAARHEKAFPTLRTGSRRYAYNVVHGEDDGRPIWIFDHHYETYSHDKNGRKTHHHHRTFVLIETDVEFPPMEARPEGFFDKIKAAFGYNDIDFESAEFSRSWHIGSPDREFAYAVFHPTMIEFFQTLGGMRMSTAGAYALFRIGSGRMDESEIRTTMRHASGFMERLPRYLRKDHAR